MKSFLLLACLAAMPAVAAAPADLDVTGTWTIDGDVSGVSVAETCALTQDAEGKLTGSCDTSTGKYDVKGSVASKTATFSHGGKYDGSDLTITFTGKLGDDGKMKGTMDVDPFSVSGNFTATKGAPAAK